MLPEVLIPLAGALAAGFASAVKNWLSRKTKSEIVINLGDGSKITLDGSEESREKVRSAINATLREVEKK